ncbi:MalY/PatB family protein [Schaalia vaccimaxillae]|uniref:MalY/PatB family protein n=1 Tax=Schaalia vaccimaxillae TaxID=183916 RepID=UPI0003B51A31|nr:aminotransferase class I/II-fold pyridoxal phosphate-dependent enzyme [Schaalia vaccimaxillae]
MTNDAFTRHLNRWGTHSAKWDLLAADLGSDAICLSVADMEFTTCPEVVDAVIKAAEHASYGYTEIFPDFAQAAAGWQRRRHSWDVDPSHVHFFPRVVQCVSALVNFILRDKECSPVTVVSLSPAYSPLIEVCEASGAEIRRVELISDVSSSPTIDWESLDKALTGSDLLLWCNPHNPTGRVWHRDELEFLCEIARRNSFLILSDDIHGDFERPGRNRYTPLATLCPDLWEDGRLIHCASPGKTFTIAGLEATAVITTSKMGERLEAAKRRMGLHNPNYFSIPASIAAWTQGDRWVDQLLETIDSNIVAARELLTRELPYARVLDPDGTYLLWVDARHYLVSASSLEKASLHSHVAVSPGKDFGVPYEGFCRINVALPRNELLEGISRLANELRY